MKETVSCGAAIWYLSAPVDPARDMARAQRAWYAQLIDLQPKNVHVELFAAGKNARLNLTANF